MPINNHAPPESVSKVAANQLASLDRAEDRSTDTEAGGGINASSTLPVYHLDCSVVDDTVLTLASAKPVGWQYLIQQPDDIASVEIVDNEAIAVDKGQVAANIAHAINVAEHEAIDQQYEARMLTFGRAGEPVLWLHPEEGESDRFFSLGPETVEMEPLKVLVDASQTGRTRSISLSSAGIDMDDEIGG